MPAKSRSRPLVAFLLLGLAIAPAAAQTFPARSIKAVLPFPAGSGTDPVARFIGERMFASLGQRLIVENKPGANGAIAAVEVARAAPDGYTILFGTNSTHAANVSLYKKLPYDPVGGFAPVTRVTLNPLMLVVRPELPVRDVAEFVAYAKARPGDLNYGTGNTGGLAATQMLKTMTGVDVVQVSYRGTPAAVTDLLGGRLQFMFTDPAVVQDHVQTGALKALAVTSAQRMSAFPHLPTMAEAGLPGYELVSWIAVFAPAGTPADVVATLNKAIREAIDGDQARDFFDKLAMERSTTSPEELSRWVVSEIEKWGKVIEAAGIEKQ